MQVADPDALTTSGGTVWFTGLSGAGKTTVAEALHDLRIAVKWLRYALDFHGETCGLAYDAERALSRDLQDCLGEMRDHDLLAAALAADGAGAWRQVRSQLTEGRHRLWRRFLELQAALVPGRPSWAGSSPER